MKNKIHKSQKLDGIGYDIRGPVLERAQELEKEGKSIIKLNIGNLAAFGFEAPSEVVSDIVENLGNNAGYTDSKGLYSARRAVVQYTESQGIVGVDADDIYLGRPRTPPLVHSLF